MTSAEENNGKNPQGSDPSEIKLQESEPLTHNPFVHLTLDPKDQGNDQAQASPQAVNQVNGSQGIPYAAFQARGPEKPSRMSRTFPNKQSSSQSHQASTAAFSANTRDRSRSYTSGADASKKEDKQDQGPSLRVVLEPKEGEVKTDPAHKDKSQDVQIGADHINVPEGLHDSEELQEMAASFPKIPKNLIFEEMPGTSKGSAGNQQGRCAGFPGQSQRTGSMATAPLSGAQSVNGNPRNMPVSPHFRPPGVSSAMASANGFAQRGAAPQNGFNQGMQNGQRFPSSQSPNQNQVDPNQLGRQNPMSGAAAANLFQQKVMPSPLSPYHPTPDRLSTSSLGTWMSPNAGNGVPFGARGEYPNGSSQNPFDTTMQNGMGGIPFASPQQSMPLGASQPLPTGNGAMPMQNPSLGQQNSQPLGGMGAGMAPVSGANANMPGVQQSPSQRYGQTSRPLPTEPLQPFGSQAPNQNLGLSGQWNPPSDFQSQPTQMLGQQNANGQGSMPAQGFAPNGMSNISAPGAAPTAVVPAGGASVGAVRSIQPSNRQSMFVSPAPINGNGAANEESSIFDQPPVPLSVGMKVADKTHKRSRRWFLMIVMILILAAAGTFAYLALTGTINLKDIIPTITIVQNGEESSGGSSSQDPANNTGQSETGPGSSGQNGISDTDSNTVVYQYTASTTDGTTYNVEETATFSEEGYCQFTTMIMEFPDAERAKAFTDNLARDYGSSFTLDSLDGAVAVATIDNSKLRLDREAYEQSLRYSVEDLVILKK